MRRRLHVLVARLCRVIVRRLLAHAQSKYELTRRTNLIKGLGLINCDLTADINGRYR